MARTVVPSIMFTDPDSERLQRMVRLAVAYERGWDVNYQMPYFWSVVRIRAGRVSTVEGTWMVTGCLN